MIKMRTTQQIKEYMKEYNNRPGIKEHIKTYQQKYYKNPINSEKRRLYQYEWYHKHKSERNEDDRIRNKNPDRHKAQQIWLKNHPECMLKSVLKRNKELGLIYNMTGMETSKALISWGKTIKKLNNNTCQICDSNENIKAHHIFHKAKYPQLMFNINNGIALCNTHHNETHGWRLF